MQEIVTLACEKWAAGDKVTSWQIIKITRPMVLQCQALLSTRL